ncbi:MAG: nucleotide-binding protein [Verrucomicrobiota bacterium]
MKHLTSLITPLLFVTVLAISQTTAGAGGFSGKVVETMDAAGYTYVLVDTGTNKIWAATTQFEIKTNDVVSVPDSMPMNDFHSKSLNRDFPVIYFTGNMTVNGKNTGAAKLPEGHPAIGGNAGAELPANHPPTAGLASPSKPDFTGLKPAPGGKTVAEVYAASAKLSGKSVKIRGKVVKYNADIMGKNWLHIQDGTGKPGSNDLLVTTLGKAKTGDTVLIEGKVAINQDFGAGYKYKVLVADATVTVE